VRRVVQEVQLVKSQSDVKLDPAETKTDKRTRPLSDMSVRWSWHNVRKPIQFMPSICLASLNSMNSSCFWQH